MFFFINCDMNKQGLFIICMTGVMLIHSNIFACNECHSTNPKMVKMHQELGYKDCFVCHGIGPKKSPEEQKMRMANDQLCVRCHGK